MDMEKDLAKHITNLSDTFYGLSVVQRLELACRIGKANHLDQPSSRSKNSELENIGLMDSERSTPYPQGHQNVLLLLKPTALISLL